MNSVAIKFLVLGGILLIASYGIIFLFAFAYGFCLPLMTHHIPTANEELSWIWPVGICSLIFKVCGLVFLISGIVRYFVSSVFRKPVSE
jgi:hypothetical protein